MNVIMVHGFWDTGRLFRRMGQVLEERGHTCLAPTLEPRDGRLGIPDLSGKLALFIESQVQAVSPIALVGFSMGALVARHYLQCRGGAGRAKVFFSLSGPHRGTFHSYLYPGLGTRQMRPGSAFLKELEGGREALRAVSLYSYRTPFDLMVVPSTSAQMTGAHEFIVWSPFHSMIPGNPKIIRHIAAVLGAIEARPEARFAAPGPIAP